MNESQLAKSTVAAVMAAFKSQFNYLPDEVLGLDDQPPTASNGFLYNDALDSYEGKIRVASGKMYFSLVRDRGGNWRGSFIPITNPLSK